MRIAITGSNGFIGSELAKHFLSQGNEVVLLQRKKPETLSVNAHYFHFDLNQENNLTEIISSLDVLIHTAYVPEQKGNNSSKKNLEGTLALEKICAENKVQFIFFSTLSATDDAISTYGKHKFELENKLNKTASLILKLGLVTGSHGLYSRIKKIVEQSKFIPLIGGGNQPEQTVSVEQVVSTVALCIQQKTTGLYFLANPKVQTLKEIFARLAAEAEKKPIFIPVPFFVAEIGIRLLELLHIASPVTTENLNGLKRMRAFDTKADWNKLGLP